MDLIPTRADMASMLAKIVGVRNRMGLTMLVHKMKQQGFIDEAGEFRSPALQRILHRRFDALLYAEAKAYESYNAPGAVEYRRVIAEQEAKYIKQCEAANASARVQAQAAEQERIAQIARDRMVEREIEESRQRAIAVVNQLPPWDVDDQLPLSDSRRAPVSAHKKTLQPKCTKIGDNTDAILDIDLNSYHQFVTKPTHNDCDHDNWEADVTEFGNPEIFSMVPLSFNYEVLYSKDRLYTPIGSRKNGGHKHESFSPYW